MDAPFEPPLRPASAPAPVSADPPDAGAGFSGSQTSTRPMTWLDGLQAWPWAETARMLVRRFREDRLGLTAGSLTFTTLISLVPLLAVGLAVFTAFPMFAAFQAALEGFLLRHLVPEGIARPLMAGLSRFAGQASQMGAWGFIGLVLSALALLMTIDRSLNDLWRVRRRRSLSRRVLLYWTLLTLGPVVLGAVLALTSWVLSASRGWVSALPGGLGWAVETVQFLLVAGGAAALFQGVPNTSVRWSHAAMGGFFVAVGTVAAKAGLGAYLAAVPAMRSIYGAFAVVPIVLLWVYLLWVVVLLGAVIAAYAPALRQPLRSAVPRPGQRFEWALSMLAALQAARVLPARGLSGAELADALQVDPLALDPVLQGLIELGWVGRVEGTNGSKAPYVMLVDPAREPAVALIDRMLLAPSPVTEPFRRAATPDTLRLEHLLEGLPDRMARALAVQAAGRRSPWRKASSTPSGASAIRS